MRKKSESKSRRRGKVRVRQKVSKSMKTGKHSGT